MKLLERFKYFGFGIAIGCSLVYFMLVKDREFPAWLPEDRVIEELTIGPISVSPEVELPFADSLLEGRIDASEVLFDESNVRENPCRKYQLESDLERMRVSICDSVVTLIEYQKK